MKIEDWFEWPTRSSDPGINVAIAVLLVLAAIILFAIGLAVALPLVIAIGVGYGIYRYVNRPAATVDVLAHTEQRAISANFPSVEQFSDAHIQRMLDAVLERRPPAYSIFRTMMHISHELYAAENFVNPLPPLPPKDTIEEGRYRDMLIAHQKKTADAPKTLASFAAALSNGYLAFIDDLPPIARVDPDVFAETDDHVPFATFPLQDLLPQPGKAVEDLISPMFAEPATELGLFQGVRRQLDRNVSQAFAGEEAPLPSAFEGSADEAVRSYLKSTPFEALFHAPIPFSLTDVQRFEHMHVVGGSGHGKTQLLQHLIMRDLRRPDPPALIVIDSQGEMLRKIERFNLFAPGQPLADKLIVIDPEDVEHPPALNMFDVASGRLGSYSQAEKEQIEASTIEMFNYVFGALAAELTSKQNTTFAFVARLMLTIPGATVHTLRELFEDAAQSIEQSPFRDHILRLDPTSQAYFQNQFFTRAYAQTKQQIARRLYGVLQVPAFDRMFASRRNKLDMFAAMQNGSIVLINTSKALLKSDASALFGRHMIARVIAAAFERVALSPGRRNPAFLIVDEAAEYFDDNLESLLAQARKYNVGVLFAHQHLDQLSSSLRAAVAANTSIKLAGGISDRDARALAADMRTTPDFIADMRKHGHSTEFACYVRNVTANAVRLEIPFGTLEACATMSVAAQQEVRAANRARYAVSPDDPRPAAASPDPPPAVEPAADSAAGDDWRS
jgi:hypothetical protein